MEGSTRRIETQRSRPLAGLLVSQFTGSFNDNAWKYVILTLAMRPIIAATGGTGAEFTRASQAQATRALLVFTVPVILFSLPGGALADRLSKRSVLVGLKAAEIALMAAATLSLLFDPGGMIVPLVILGLMGVQSALFSPAKYGLLPEIVPHERLSWGNGILHMLMMVALIAGTGLGPVLLLVDEGGSRPELTWVAPLLLTFLALAGWRAALAIPRVAGVGSTGGIRATVRAGWEAIRSDRALGLTVAGMTLGMTAVSLIGQNVYVYARDITHAMRSGEILSGLPPALFAIGIGAGAVVAGKLSQAKVETGLIPLGAILFTLVALLLGTTQPELPATVATMFFLGIGAGLLIVPLNALLQWRSPETRRGAVIALANIFQTLGLAGGSLGASALARTGLSSGDLLLASALLTALGAVWAVWLLPSALVRSALLLLTHSAYRLKIVGSSHVPAKGGAVLVPNHISAIDGLVVLASLDRPVRFLVHSRMYNKWWLRPFMKALDAVEISPTASPRVLLRALRDAGRRLDEGELVCIFPEGQVTHTGALLSFHRGLEHLVRGRDVPIIPVHLDRIWGSIFSFKRERFVTKIPERLPYPITVAFGEPLPAKTGLEKVRQKVMELGTDAWEYRRHDLRPLHRELIRAVRRRPWRFAMGDGDGRGSSRVRALANAIAVARALRASWSGHERVGILLPPSLAGAAVNIAASLSGRAAVNLNYTAGESGLASAARQASLKNVVTSRTFLEKAKVRLPPGVDAIYLEDLAGSIGAGVRLASFLLALAAPVRLIERWCGASRPISLDDDVTVIFSSGSTGEPKGVRLTHYNVASNVHGVHQVLATCREDRLLGILPLFHSFGYMTLWYAAQHGIGLVFHPNPLDAERIGEVVAKRRVTMLIATPTFLQLYLRRCAPEHFGSLRLVLTGAERLPPKLASAFEERFGIRPVEGYGATECSPVIATSTLDVRFRGLYQPGSRRGSVGRPLPGVSVRIVDPDTGVTLGTGETGMVLVRGPNVMRGYLGRDDLTREVLRDGWYVTGDLGQVDKEGFLRITDRLSRFSKIGGEMVPHGRVEDTLHEVAAAKGQTFAVTSLADERRGERLVVLHTFEEEKIPALLERVRSQGLPNLFVPRPDQFVRVNALPLLGSGKPDLRALRRAARERLEVRNVEAVASKKESS